MKSYSDFLSEVSQATQSSVCSILQESCKNLNGLNSIICSSSNPSDVELVKKVTVESNDIEESLW